MFFQHLIRLILPSSIKDILQVGSPFSLNRRLGALNIEEAGVSDGIPFIRLSSSHTFHGYIPSGMERMLYRLYLSRALKKEIPCEAFRVALDILFRYVGSERNPLGQGKYYDFRPGETVVECGAYLGFYSLRAAELVGENGKVIAIEAIPENYLLLEKNVANLPAVIPVRRGVWSEETELTITREKRQRASLVDDIVASRERETIRCSPVDAILGEHGLESADFIRIQVNGAEIEALEGMQKTLASASRVMVSALYKRNGQPAYRLVASILEEKGFTVSVQNGNVLGIRKS